MTGATTRSGGPTEPNERGDVEPDETRDIVREGVTMALYISLSLLAALAAIPAFTSEDRTQVAVTVFLTAVALLVAHIVAYSVSTRLVTRGTIDAEARRTLAAQILAGLIVAVVATAPALLVDSSSSLELAGFLLTAFIAAVAFTAAKQAGGSNARALIYTALVLVFACIILVIKHAVH